MAHKGVEILTKVLNFHNASENYLTQIPISEEGEMIWPIIMRVTEFLSQQLALKNKHEKI